MTDIARIMDDFEGYKSKYINASDKTTTGLYKYIERHGGNMSVIKLSSRYNKKEEITNYMRNTYVNEQDPVEGVVFTIDGQTYADLKGNYNTSTRHVSLNVSGHERILEICQAMIDNGESFSYPR